MNESLKICSIIYILRYVLYFAIPCQCLTRKTNHFVLQKFKIISYKKIKYSRVWNLSVISDDKIMHYWLTGQWCVTYGPPYS